MAKRRAKPKTVKTLKHEEAKRPNIPTAEFQSIMRKDEQNALRVAYERRNREGAARNERFREMLESAEFEVTAETLKKLRLWEEQGAAQGLVCPYNGRVLSFEMVVSHQTETDHILPFSRTLDNSLANQVVCVTDANRAKGNRSPFEAFGHNPPGYDFDQILARAAVEWSRPEGEAIGRV